MTTERQLYRYKHPGEPQCWIETTFTENNVEYHLLNSSYGIPVTIPKEEFERDYESVMVSKNPMKDHIYREMINDLRFIAELYKTGSIKDYGRLRTIIKETVGKAIEDYSGEIELDWFKANRGHLVAVEREDVGGWRDISESPKNIPILIYYKNQCNKGRVVKALYAEKNMIEASDDYCDDFAEYSESEDTYYVPEGWYECIDNWDELSHAQISERPTHFMPLPPAPKATSGEDRE